MNYILYKTTNLINGKIYVGIHKLKSGSDSYLGSGKVLLRAIKKYGRDNFKRETLAEVPTLREARLLEFRIVDNTFVDHPQTYNMITGGGLPPSRLGISPVNKGKIGLQSHTEETKKAIRASSLGRRHTPEAIEKMKEARRRRDTL
jgi:hypothetical protein